MARQIECVQCGFCCRQCQCFYGEWDATLKKCKFLMQDNKCAKYNEIVERERFSVYPMMGSGCSSSLFNSCREEKIRENLENSETQAM